MDTKTSQKDQEQVRDFVNDSSEAKANLRSRVKKAAGTSAMKTTAIIVVSTGIGFGVGYYIGKSNAVARVMGKAVGEQAGEAAGDAVNEAAQRVAQATN